MNDTLNDYRLLDFPELRSLKVKVTPKLDHRIVAIKSAPKLTSFHGTPGNLLSSDFEDLEEVKLEASFYSSDTPQQANLKLSDMISSLQNHELTMRKVELLADYQLVGHGTSIKSIDLFLRYLYVNLGMEAHFPNLSQLTIADEIVYDKTLLASVLTSRRIASISSNSVSDEVGEGNLTCERMTIYPEVEGIEVFRLEEEKVLARLPEGLQTIVGRAEVVEAQLPSDEPRIEE